MRWVIVLILICLFPAAAAAASTSELQAGQSSGGSSNETLNILQPATPASLQGAPADREIRQAPETQSLQQTQGADQVKALLAGETEGRQSPGGAENKSGLWLIPLALAGLAGWFWWLDRKRELVEA